MTATDKLNEVITAIPALASYVDSHRASGLTDEEVLVRLKAVVNEVAQER
jgi:hypothetical protein